MLYLNVTETTTLTLPLLMFGKNDKLWHEEGESVKERYISGFSIVKSGKNKGKEKPVYAWREKLKKQKVLVGYDGVFTRGKNKGMPKPVYETKLLPVLSTGFFPSVNHIYINARFRGGGGRRLKPIAEDHLNKWKALAMDWQKVNQWVTQEAPVKVLVEMVFYLPSGLPADTHNSKKLLLDALEGVVHKNDFYIIDRTLDFAIDDNHPRIELQISIPDNLMPLSFN